MDCVSAARFVVAMTMLPATVWAQRAKPPPIIQEAFIGELAFTQERGEIQNTSLLRADGVGPSRAAGEF